MAKGIRTMTPGEAFIQRINRLRQEARKNNSVLNLSMKAEERAAIEEHIGRPLTNREILQGHLDRADNRTFAQALSDSKWKPVVSTKDGGDAFDAAIREAEKTVRDRQLREMKPDERTLFLLKEDQLKRQQAKASQAEHEARLADPAVASKLAELRAMQTRAAYDPSYTVGDTLTIERAILQLETPGADLEVAAQLHQAALGVAEAKRQAVVAELKAQHADAAARLAELEETLDEESGQATESETAATLDPREAAYRGDAFTNADLSGKIKIQADYWAYQAEQTAAAGQTAE